MLFDLRGRGRRRTVRIIYTGLALLMGVGLVGFGIGGGFGSSGILNVASSNEGSSGASFAGQIKKYNKLTKQYPTSLSDWEQLTKAYLHEGAGEAYVSSTGIVTSKGKELFRETAAAWAGYLALNPPKPSLEIAKEMLRIFGEEGLNEATNSVQALQLIVAAEPTNASYLSQLAESAYRAKNTRVGDLAAEKAVASAPAADRQRIKTELAEVRKNPTGEKTYTTKTNGKTYLVKKSANGTFTGTLSTPSPPATSTTSK